MRKNFITCTFPGHSKAIRGPLWTKNSPRSWGPGNRGIVFFRKNRCFSCRNRPAREPGTLHKPDMVFLPLWALLKPFTIRPYLARIAGIDTLNGFNLKVSTEPRYALFAGALRRRARVEGAYLPMTLLQGTHLT